MFQQVWAGKLVRVRKDLWLTFHLEEIGSRGAGNIQSKQLKEDWAMWFLLVRYSSRHQNPKDFGICISDSAWMMVSSFIFIFFTFFFFNFTLFYFTILYWFCHTLLKEFCLCWVLVAVRVFSCGSLSCCGAGSLKHRISGCLWHAGFSCPSAGRTFPDQESNPGAPHWQADSQPLCQQGSLKGKL